MLSSLLRFNGETSYARDILLAVYENTTLRLPSHFLTTFEYTLRSFCLSAFSCVPCSPFSDKKLSPILPRFGV